MKKVSAGEWDSSLLEAWARPAAVAVELQSGLETREVRPSGWCGLDCYETSDVFPSRSS